ncbi:MAG: MerR family transcriptional regulator [Candidatus Lindowbacteria bacterium]|nr:MerR family transcriptional regulator [Candidatus Lindowbacteria bacterium]
MADLNLEEVVKETGISVRNIKYWSALYDLEFIKQGRRNYYPRKTVDLLKVIGELSELQLFTTNLVRILVDASMGRKFKDDNIYNEYKEKYTELSKCLGQPLPALPSFSLKKQVSGSGNYSFRRPVGQRDDDDALL